MSAAAFFDLDGTLVPSPSLERRLVWRLIRRGELGATQAAHWLTRFLRLAARDWLAATAGNKAYLAGISTQAMEAWEADRGPLEVNFCRQGLESLQRHSGLNHRIVLVSGTLAPLARCAARELEHGLHLNTPILVCATELEQLGGILSGETAGPHVLRKGKARIVREIAAKYDFDLRASFAYGNSAADEEMLACTGHPVAVNPDASLKRRALKEGWAILHWDAPVAARGFERSRASPTHFQDWRCRFRGFRVPARASLGEPAAEEVTFKATRIVR
jgi:alcohol-forming fatty acyl-CoA reductase